MENRSRLDEIEDYNFTVNHLVYKDLAEPEIVMLPEKQRLDSFQIDKLITEVKSDYSGMAMIESSSTVKTFSRIIDLIFVVILIMLSDWLIPQSTESNALLEWLIILSAALIYYISLESIFGITVGKVITGSQLVDQNYERPGALRVFVRVITSVIPNIESKRLCLVKHSLITFQVNRKKLKRLNNLN